MLTNFDISKKTINSIVWSLDISRSQESNDLTPALPKNRTKHKENPEQDSHECETFAQNPRFLETGCNFTHSQKG